MRRMITDKQLDGLKSTNLKIIELDKSISSATITQEQYDPLGGDLYESLFLSSVPA